MLRLMYLILLAVLAAYLLIGVLLYVIQRSFIYFPTEAINHSFKVRDFESHGETLKVISLNSNAKSAILYFGGNAESVAYTAPDLKNHLPQYAIFLVNYRGYGGSSGTPSEAALYADALRIYDALILDYEKIHVIGRSLGSGVASYVAAKRKVEKLVMVTPFDSIQNIAQQNYPFYPIAIMLKDKFDSAGRAAQIKADTLILRAENDSVVPKERTERLVENFNDAQLSVVVVEQTEHNNILESAKYLKTLKSFLN